MDSDKNSIWHDKIDINATFYDYPLYIINKNEEIKTQSGIKSINIEGQKKITIVLSDIKLAEEKSEYYDFLKNILQSINMFLPNVHFTTPNGELENEIPFMLVFDENLISQNIYLKDNFSESELYSPVSKYGKRVIFAHELGIISQNKELKMKLWKALKSTFL